MTCCFLQSPQVQRDKGCTWKKKLNSKQPQHDFRLLYHAVVKYQNSNYIKTDEVECRRPIELIV